MHWREKQELHKMIKETVQIEVRKALSQQADKPNEVKDLSDSSESLLVNKLDKSS